jgi:hypothetical protein
MRQTLQRLLSAALQFAAAIEREIGGLEIRARKKKFSGMAARRHY